MFSPDYVRLVLNDNFEDAKSLFVAPLMAIHYAHLAMLAEQGIVGREEARAIRQGLDSIDLAAVLRAKYDGHCEDLFFYLNGLLAEGCGADVAGRLHTARSRNDIDVTMYRMLVRGWVLNLAGATLDLRRSLVALARRHGESVFPAHTHAQPAQPTTVAHYLLGAVEQLERDTTRLVNAYRTVNRCPLGSCAITGTGFPIDRIRTSDLLGFDSPTGNTYGSVATVDYVLESAAAAGVLLVGLGRVVQDVLLWSTAEIGYLRLPDEFVQVSSIMPQKRNPVALEHARALSSKALAEVNAIGGTVHNTPFGDIVDTEDDLQPLVAVAFRDAGRAVSLMAVAMGRAELDVDRMRRRAECEWVTVTELADTLVRDYQLSFRVAHEIVTRFVRLGRQPGAAGLSAVFAGAARELGHDVVYSEDELRRILSPEHFVRVRRTLGGPAPEVVADAVRTAQETLDSDSAALEALRGSLDQAERRRRAAVDAL